MVRGYAVAQVVLGGVLCLVGVAMVAVTVAGGGGPLALGTVVGVAFALLGAARLWIAGAGARGERERGR